jgi:REP element-mobilizing transposase RayT
MRFIHAEWRDELHRYLGGTVKALDGVALNVGGVEDHVHLLVGLKPTHTVSDVIRDSKKSSSAWIHDNVGSREFAWQEGYGGFTVSQSNLDAVSRYITQQEEHHKKRSFQDEYREFLTRHGVDFDEKYLW